MKRSVKNLIMIALIVGLGISLVFTINQTSSNINKDFQSYIEEYLNESKQDSQETSNIQNENANQQDSNETSQENENSNTPQSQGDVQAPPQSSGTDSSIPKKPDSEKPDGESNDGSMNNQAPPQDMGNGQGPGGQQMNDSQTPPGQTNSQTEANNNESMMNDDNTNNGADISSVENEDVQQEIMEGFDVSVGLNNYVLIGIESVILFIVFMLLIITQFNKLTFAQSFQSIDKYIILVLCVILLTAGSLFTSSQLITESAKNLIEYTVENTELNIQGPGNDGQMPENNMSSNSSEYSGATVINEDTTITSGNYQSNNSDENAILVTGDIDVSLSNITVDKSASSDGGDSSNFYGINSAIIAKDGSNLTLSNINVSTTGNGANGVFSYGGSATTNNSSSDGTTVTICDSTITTTGDNAGGIMTTGGGTTNASNLQITTSGTSSAAIRSDRGGGIVNVDGGTYTTNGLGSPSIYSTATISVSNATLVSNASEGVVIEGKNSVTLNKVTLTDSNTGLNGQSTTYKNIFLYQSMSGDASDGTSSFSAIDSTITTNNGDTFYVTNTIAYISLQNNIFINNDSDGNFLRVQADSWGNQGNNGGDVTLELIDQDASGSIVVDSISTLKMSLTQGSNYTGVINSDNNAQSISLTLDSSSTLTLTGDSYVTSLSNSDTTNSNINFNGYTLYVNGVAIN